MELLVQGGPGSGKTTSSVERIREMIKEGTFDPEEIIAMSYTRTAAAELHRRGILGEDNVGTMHSFHYRMVEHSKGTLLGGRKEGKESDATDLWNADHRDWKISRDDGDRFDPEATGTTHGDQLMRRVDYLRNKLHDWDAMSQMNLSHMLDINHLAAGEVLAFYKELTRFKKTHGFIDFTDMIEIPYREHYGPPMNARMIWADECQDMTPLMWARLRQLKDEFDVFLMASGDLHQLLYDHLGAETGPMLNLPADAERYDIPVSYRLPHSVLGYSQLWNQNNTERLDYAFSAVDGAIRGSVAYDADVNLRSPHYISALANGLAQGTGETVMILTSCNHMTNSIVSALRDHGVPFHNPYRTKNGSWNPIRTTARSVINLTRNDPLTVLDIRHWLALAKTRGIVENAVVLKEKLSGPMGNTPFKDWDAFVVDNPEALVRNIHWLAENAVAASASSVNLVVKMLESNTPDQILNPAITIGTMHSVKGAEADHVIMVPDISPSMLHAGGYHSPPIVRQFYVGMTRAKNTLTLGTTGWPRIPRVKWKAIP